jgi:3-hydroxybutyryl-CoA dehydrogenase
VEVVPGRHTAPVAVERTVGVLRQVGRRPVALKHDLPGFVGNRLQHAMQREAMAIVESSAVSPEDLDDIVRNSFGLRAALLGPFERADLGGIDVTSRVQEYLLPFLEDTKIPSGLLTDRVERGDLGAKTGRGFFTWDEEKVRRRVETRDEILLRIVRLLRSFEGEDGNRSSSNSTDADARREFPQRGTPRA